jgi:hypothetical protein
MPHTPGMRLAMKTGLDWLTWYPSFDWQRGGAGPGVGGADCRVGYGGAAPLAKQRYETPVIARVSPQLAAGEALNRRTRLVAGVRQSRAKREPDSR